MADLAAHVAISVRSGNGMSYLRLGCVIKGSTIGLKVASRLPIQPPLHRLQTARAFMSIALVKRVMAG